MLDRCRTVVGGGGGGRRERAHVRSLDPVNGSQGRVLLLVAEVRLGASGGQGGQGSQSLQAHVLGFRAALPGVSALGEVGPGARCPPSRQAPVPEPWRPRETAPRLPTRFFSSGETGSSRTSALGPWPGAPPERPPLVPPGHGTWRPPGPGAAPGACLDTFRGLTPLPAPKQRLAELLTSQGYCPLAPHFIHSLVAPRQEGRVQGSRDWQNLFLLMAVLHQKCQPALPPPPPRPSPRRPLLRKKTPACFHPG